VSGRRDFVNRMAILIVAWPITSAFNHENAENTQIWTTFEGKQIRIVDLTDDHLRNIIFFLNKQLGASYGLISDGRGAPAHMGHTPDERWPIYDVLRREATHRNLSWI
jgi:hypothetical protein